MLAMLRLLVASR